MAIFGQSLVNRARDVTRCYCASPVVLTLPQQREPPPPPSWGRREEASESRREVEASFRGQRKEAEYRNRRGLNEPRLSKQEIKARSGAWEGDQESSWIGGRGFVGRHDSYYQSAVGFIQRR